MSPFGRAPRGRESLVEATQKLIDWQLTSAWTGNRTGRRLMTKVGLAIWRAVSPILLRPSVYRRGLGRGVEPAQPGHGRYKSAT
jgi:hypothetical protein